MPREIPGIDALAKAYPSEWLLYVSLNCYPRNQSPMEIDAIVVLDDRVLVLEIKDWNGKLTQQGDRWFVGGQSRGRSAVTVVEEKAKKLKSIIRSEIPQLASLWVDFRVVLTAVSTKEHLPDDQRRYVWSQQEACSISDPSRRAALLEKRKLGIFKLFNFEREFDRITGNPKIFQPSEAEWGGYRVIEQDFVVHPCNVWREHRAERKGEARLKGLLRVWAFENLPPGLNSPDRRKLVAQREIKALAHLTALGSDLIERNGILRDIGSSAEEILTQHFELRALPPEWTTLDRFLESKREDLDLNDRIVLAMTLLTLVADLHKGQIAHRDIGHRCIWVGGATKLALSGLMSCQLPDEESVSDWLEILRGYAPPLPEDQAEKRRSTGRQRDVYLVGLLVRDILTRSHSTTDSGSVAVADNGDLGLLSEWFIRSVSNVPEQRFPDAMAMAAEFGQIAERIAVPAVDQSLLDLHETTTVPYVKWKQDRMLSSGPRCLVYISTRPEQPAYVVKVWNGLLRGISAATDLSLIRLLDGVSRVAAAPIAGLPYFEEVGLSPVGPYVVYRHEAGIPIDHVQTITAEDALCIVEQIITSIMKLHDLGCEHGDISGKNIVYDANTRAICILDAFDVSPIGDGSVRTPTFCPTNWESLGQQSLDRFAALKISQDLLKRAEDTQLTPLIDVIAKELERPSIDTFDVTLAYVRHTLTDLTLPPLSSFVVYSRDISPGDFESDQGSLFLRRARVDSDLVQYWLTGTNAELVLDERNGVLVESRFKKVSFAGLAHASRKGVPVQLKVSVVPGPKDGFVPLYEFLKTKVESIEEIVDVSSRQTSPHFDVPRHWRRLMDLEAEDRIEIEIIEEIVHRGATSVYVFKNTGGNFDFDPEDLIDVYLPPNKRVGEVDQSISDSTRTIAVSNVKRRLSAGDIVFLANRRDQTSIDRRSKATKRILDRQSAVPGLIDYFCPNATPPSIDFQICIPDKELLEYGLNPGQNEAFTHFLRYGPVGLLQGPPGTGKTRFIASFVHWLVTKGGARRILIASQSHEAVNNVIEALVSLYKRFGGRPSLLRIGSKGITDKIRPYHASELRERYRLRFNAAFRYRISLLASTRGISRELTSDVVDLDQTLGTTVRRCLQLRNLAKAGGNAALSAENKKDNQHLRRAEAALQAAAQHKLGRTFDLSKLEEEVERAYRSLLVKHPGSSPADLATARNIMELSRDWLNSMASPQRNFEEFLAKTRTIVTGTCVGVGQTRIRIDTTNFDWVIVDEAARCTPGELAVPIQLGRRILLVGDHLQLMPMIKRDLVSQLEEENYDVPREELIRSDFERAFTSGYGRNAGRMLTEQYRMDPAICELVSACFYKPHRVTLQTSKERKPTTDFCPGLSKLLSLPLCWIDTSTEANHVDAQSPNSTTFYNEAEVAAVIKALECISEQKEMIEAVAQGDDEFPIGVICMYSGQRKKIEMAFARHAWAPHFRRLVRIDTVDAYQGKQNAIVIVSLVRANRLRVQGHVASDNRCNVAISRAKERLIVIGSRRMWSGVNRNSPICRVLDFMVDHPAIATTMSMRDLE